MTSARRDGGASASASLQARVHHLFIISLRCIARRNRLANQGRRFVQKSGFGERRCGAKPLTMKIFLLPKSATQSPRSVPFSRPRSVATTSAVRRSFNDSMTKAPAAQSLPALLTAGVFGFYAHLASLRDCIVVLSMNARSKSALGHVNTSLSRTLFFSMCWCIRDAVHSIPGCTQRLSHLTTLGGQHGQES